jgi:hypothetical protein
MPINPLATDVSAPRTNAPTVQNYPIDSSTSRAMMIEKMAMKIAKILYSAYRKAVAPSSTLFAMLTS